MPDSHLNLKTPSSQLASNTPPLPSSHLLAQSHHTHSPLISDPENINVIVRLRPVLQLVQPLDASANSPHFIPRTPRPVPLATDCDLDPDCPYTLEPDHASIFAGGSWFTFDGVYPPSSTTAEIYENHIASMIRDAVGGYNSTLFAYGATGSGKSHCMIGGAREDGIMARAIDDIFDLIEQDQEREYVVRVSYLEIYNEQLRDLLSNERPSPTQPQPKIHEDRQGRIFVRPLVSTPCGGPEDVVKLLLCGESRRRTERTEWNLRSSRSHAIFSLTLESRPVIGPSGFPITSSTMREVTGTILNKQPQLPHYQSGTDLTVEPPDPAEVFLGTGAGKLPITPSVARFKSSASSKSSSHAHDGSIRISQLNLVDLAGSERLTDNEARNKEASYIKKSLLALQSVVSSLTELGTSTSSSAPHPKPRSLHVPYRNSQLTRLLQTSLSGNAKVAFLCTISPDADCEVETLSTLRFAAGAKKVVTKAELGQVVDRATLLEALEAKVLELEAALMTNADYTEALERERDEAIERADGAAKICDDYESKLAELQTLRTPLKEQHTHLRRLIISGSPRSSYATQTTIENHASAALSPVATISRRKSTGRRPSRLSEAAIASSPAKKLGWKELFFEEGQAEEGLSAVPSSKEQVEPNAKVNELQLAMAKLEATMAEAEDTHAGEVAELKTEIGELETRLAEAHAKLESCGGQVGAVDQEDSQVKKLEEKLAELSRQSAEKAKELEAHVKEEQSRAERAEQQLRQSEADRERMLAEAARAQEEHLESYRLQIAALEERLRAGADADEARRCSEVTLDGIVEPEEKPRSTLTKTAGRRPRSRTESKRENGGGGVDEVEGQAPVTPPRPAPARKRTASQRSRKNDTGESGKGTDEQLVRRSTRSTASGKKVVASGGEQSPEN